MSDEGVTSMAPAEDLTSRSYDYIVCGGGTAGLAVASRLSEDENVTVAVLEAGGDALNDLLVDAPSMYTQTWGNPNYDWDYKTVPQKGTAGRVHGWIRGKVLGGSSAVNYGMFSMASKQDLDNWGELGNKGWSFEDLKPYYRKFETYHPASEAYGEKIDNKYLDKSLRGTSGPIHISFAETDVTWSQDMWPKTMINAGYAPANDPRVGSAIGGFNQLCTIDPKHNRRSYAARDYYEPAKDRPNLSLLTHALVSKIELEKNADTVKATGVQFTVSGSPFTVKANREVIVCGGVVNSPQILELSGIGSPDVLQKAGVEMLVDLPGVGDNLCDHSATTIVLGVKDAYPTAEALMRNPTLTQQALEAYLTHKSGPFAAGPTTTGFASLQKVSPDLPNPQSHIDSLLASHSSSTSSDPAGRDPLMARQLLDPKEAICQLVLLPIGVNTYRPETPNQLLPCEDDGMWVTLAACSTRSFSRGSTHITSSNPEVHPAIDPAYLAHPLDLDLMARSVMHVLSFANVQPLAQIFRRDDKGGLVLPRNASGPLPTSVDEAKEWVRKNTLTEYHPVGTCAMLPREKGGVVDEELRVHGVQGLRVVDASIFPLHVQGNIVSLVYAIAEKAADMIRGRTRRSDSGHWA